MNKTIKTIALSCLVLSCLYVRSATALTLNPRKPVLAKPKPRSSTGLGAISLTAISHGKPGRPGFRPIGIFFSQHDTDSSTSSTQPGAPQHQPTPKRKILVVEDQDSWANIYTRKFRKLGAEVIAVSSAREAIEALAAGTITEVVSDGLNGDWVHVVEAAQKANTPITVISSHPDVESGAKAKGIKFLDKLDSDKLDQFLSE